nr:alpha/beta hydrolase fold domain-containing protein [Agitococcus sp.]
MSLQQQITTLIVKQSLRASFKLTSTLPLPVSALRTGMELGASLFSVNQHMGVNTTVIGGVTAELVSSQPKAKQVILHCHGGAFFTGSAKTHRALASDLSVLSGADVYMLDYRLAPEHPYPAALDDAYSAYMALLGKGYQAQQIILAGDSGGCAHIL